MHRDFATESTIVAWGFLANYKYACDPTLDSCDIAKPGVDCCSKAENMGWRYFNIVIGLMIFLMFVCRFFFFHLFESPKFLLSKGRQSEAVACVHGIGTLLPVIDLKLHADEN